MRITSKSQLQDLEYGTRFFVENGAWYGRIVRKDGVKQLEVEEPGGYTYHRLTHDDTPLDLQLSEIDVHYSKSYYATAVFREGGIQSVLLLCIQTEPWLPKRDGECAAEKQAHIFLDSILQGRSYVLSVDDRQPIGWNSYIDLSTPKKQSAIKIVEP